MKSKRYGSLLTVLNGMLIGIALILSGWGQRRTWGFELIAVGMAFYANGFFRGNRLFVESRTPKTVKFALGILIGFIGIYVFRQLFQDLSVFSSTSGGLYIALDYFFKNVGLFLILVAIFYGQKSPPQIQGIIAIVMGVGVWASGNHVVDWFGLSIGGEDQQNEFGESRFEFADYRWLPPLIRSNWSFAANCSVAVIVGLVLLTKSFGKQGLYWNNSLRVIYLMVIAAAAVASVRCQFRAQLILLPLGVLWLLCARWRVIKIALVLSLLAWFAVAPFLLSGTGGENLLDILQGDNVLNAIGGKANETTISLSGRTQLYDVGLEKLQEPTLLLLGEGPSFRDSGVILGTATGAAHRGISYHSGFLDLLLTHGAPLAGLFLAALGICLWQLFQLDRNSGYVSDACAYRDASLIHFCGWLALSATDPGMFQYCDSFLLALVPLFGVLRYVPQTPFAAKPESRVQSRFRRPAAPGLKEESPKEVVSYGSI